MHLLNHCVSGYRGKNWVPLVYREQLYVVHRISPELKWFKYDVHDGCAAPTGPPETEDIDQWRGGSAFVPWSSTLMISFGHRRIDYNTHSPFLIVVDMATNRSRLIAPLTHEPWRGILDPTSLWWGPGGRLWMGTVRTSGSWKKLYFKGCDECAFNMTVYEVQLKQPTSATRVNYFNSSGVSE